MWHERFWPSLDALLGNKGKIRRQYANKVHLENDSVGNVHITLDDHKERNNPTKFYSYL